FQRSGGRYGYYDAYDDAHSSVSEGTDSDDPERGDSEEEMRKYTRKGRYAPGEALDPFTIGEEMYYFGAIHLDQARVRSILVNEPPPPEYHRLPPIEKAAYLFYVAVYKKQYNDLGDFHRKFNREYFKYTCDGDPDNMALWKARVRSILVNEPPPPEYHRLPPIEKAAYLFYVAVYKKQYNDLGDFHRKFNREYFKYTCDGDPDNMALWKICKSMQEEYLTKKLAESQKAYEASQRQLFSDERESVDG
ncbi:hypothetical protein NECAME_14455, partial [Necator americanus]